MCVNNYFTVWMKDPRRGSGDVAQWLVLLKFKAEMSISLPENREKETSQDELFISWFHINNCMSEGGNHSRTPSFLQIGRTLVHHLFKRLFSKTQVVLAISWLLINVVLLKTT